MSTNNIPDLPEVPRGPRRNDRYTFEIYGVNDKGHGLGSYEALVGPQKQYKKYPFAIRGAVPGDVIDARVTNDKRKNREAAIVDVITASADRVDVQCPHVAVGTSPQCGGCSMQAIDYDEQLAIKKRWLEKRLRLEGIEVPVADVIGLPDPWRFRNKMEWSFGELPDGSIGLGMHPPGYRYEVIDHQTCLICPAVLLDATTYFSTWAREYDLVAQRGQKGTLTSVAMRVNRDDAVQCVLKSREPIPDDLLSDLATRLPEAFSLYVTIVDAERGRPTIETTHVVRHVSWIERLEVAGTTFEFEVEPQAFFQTNTAQTETLYDAAIAAAQKLAPHDATVWDLYCGCGTITAALASKFQHVVGIEAVPESVISATKNAARNRLDNVSFLQGDALEIFAHTTEKPSLIVVDPPRAGMNRPVVDALANLGAPIVYVSCNPKTLARDLALLCGFGYSITSVQPIDMFPHTAHVETVVALNAPNHTNN